MIKVKEPRTSDQTALQIDALFANSPAETKTATEKAFVQAFAEQIGDIGTIMMAISGVALLFILLITGNTMAQSIRERTSELGVLKTLGFTEGRILSLVLLESCFVAILGGGVGLLLVVDVHDRCRRPDGRLPAHLLSADAGPLPRCGVDPAARLRHGYSARLPGEPHEDRRRAPEKLT